MESLSLDAKASSSQKPAWLGRRLALGVTPAGLLLAAIILISIFFHFYNIGAIGEANTYYTAGVKSMLLSWKNFFYAAAEPGGSVTLDKPPLGFWIEAAFAAVLGVNGFAVSLPNILAGLLSIPLLYHLVKKQFGSLAGLTAALVLAGTPVVVSTDRNNTIDGMLMFTLLLAAWAFILAVESGKARFLYLGAVLVGLGFNIKMLEAFLPLPAFSAFYLLASKTGWGRKLFNLAVATAILLVVSFSWAVVVDLTPATQRPYVGSSPDNSEMSLIFGYNGLARLLGNARGLFGRQGGRPPAGGINNAFNPPGGPGFPGGGAGGGALFANETGQPGLFRLFQPPLANEMSWMLPFALISILLLAFSGRLHLPVENKSQQALLLWGGWLLTCVVFFSMAHFFHSYYMIMLAPALGAVTAGGFDRLWPRSRRASWLLAASALVTIAFQIFLAQTYRVEGAWILLPLALFLLGTGLVAWISWQDESDPDGPAAMSAASHEAQAGIQTPKKASAGNRGIQKIQRGAHLCLLAAMLAIPLAWTMQTATQDNPDVNLPAAYAGNAGGGPGRGGPGPGGFPGGAFNPGGFGGPSGANNQLIAYLQAHTPSQEYLVAVQSANQGAPIVLATGRPVLYMGGFSGSDPVIDAQGLAQLVAEGRLRYVLGGGGTRGGDGSINSWVSKYCKPVHTGSQNGAGQPLRGGGIGGALYDCAP
jgi:4-amino-4-deoxy-L-arabinose transferase-like glycosyltransferase